MTMLSSFPLAERAKNRYNNCHIKGGICMPVLKFICPKCKHIYEELVRVGQTAPCPCLLYTSSKAVFAYLALKGRRENAECTLDFFVDGRLNIRRRHRPAAAGNAGRNEMCIRDRSSRVVPASIQRQTPAACMRAITCSLSSSNASVNRCACVSKTFILPYPYPRCV